MPDNQHLMAIPEVPAHTRMPKGALANLRYIGAGPAHLKLSEKSLVYRRDTVDAWLDAAERTGTAA